MITGGTSTPRKPRERPGENAVRPAVATFSRLELQSFVPVIELPVGLTVTGGDKHEN
jgi:hypothetical protein